MKLFIKWGGIGAYMAEVSAANVEQEYIQWSSPEIGEKHCDTKDAQYVEVDGVVIYERCPGEYNNLDEETDEYAPRPTDRPNPNIFYEEVSE